MCSPGPQHAPNRARKELLSERIRNMLPDGTRYRARAVHIRVAGVREPCARRVVDLERDPARTQARVDVTQAQRDDVEQRGPRELVEHHLRVEPVQELRRKMRLGCGDDGRARVRRHFAV